MATGRLNIGSVKNVLAMTTLTLRTSPAMKAWEAFEKEMTRIGVAPAVRERVALAAYEAIVVAALKRRGRQLGEP